MSEERANAQREAEVAMQNSQGRTTPTDEAMEGLQKCIKVGWSTCAAALVELHRDPEFDSKLDPEWNDDREPRTEVINGFQQWATSVR